MKKLNLREYIKREVRTHMLKEAAGKSRIDSMREILRTRSMQKVDGKYVDGQTANAYVTVYDHLNSDQRKKLEKLPLIKAIDVVWKMLKTK